jgi:hypothetical protein
VRRRAAGGRALKNGVLCHARPALLANLEPTMQYVSRAHRSRYRSAGEHVVELDVQVCTRPPPRLGESRRAENLCMFTHRTYTAIVPRRLFGLGVQSGWPRTCLARAEKRAPSLPSRSALRPRPIARPNRPLKDDWLTAIDEDVRPAQTPPSCMHGQGALHQGVRGRRPSASGVSGSRLVQQ